MTQASLPTVVINDSDDAYLGRLAQLLGNTVVAVQPATSASEVIHAISAKAPLVVLADSRLPLQELAEICSCAHSNHAHVVVTVPDLDQQLIDASFCCGADDVVVKPLTEAYLKTKLHIWLLRSGYVA